MKNNKVFLPFIVVYFALSGIFHFVRLAFEWDIIVKNYYLRPWMSAACILLAVFVIYWIYRIKKTSNKEIKVEIVEEEESVV